MPAEVIAIIPTADRNKATVRVRIALLEKNPRVLPDMGVKVAFLKSTRPHRDRTVSAIRISPCARKDRRRMRTPRSMSASLPSLVTIGSCDVRNRFAIESIEELHPR